MDKTTMRFSTAWRRSYFGIDSFCVAQNAMIHADQRERAIR